VLHCNAILATTHWRWRSAAPRWWAGFFPVAITTARDLAAELGLTARARFVQADLYDAPAAIPEPGAFGPRLCHLGALCWLPDVACWAQVVAHFLKRAALSIMPRDIPPHWCSTTRPHALTGRPGFFAPYFLREH